METTFGELVGIEDLDTNTISKHFCAVILASAATSAVLALMFLCYLYSLLLCGMKDEMEDSK